MLYQLGWFACVIGTAWGFQAAGVSLACVFLILHFFLASDRSTQIKLSAVAAILGLILDSLQLGLGVFAFPRGTAVGGLPPLFMSVLWMQFATTFRYCMGWLSGRYVLSAVFGLVGAPIAFYAGERLGAIEFLDPRHISFLVLGLLWSAAVPLLVLLSDRLDPAATDPAYRWPTCDRS